jgi:hypothetical protein
MQIAAEYDGTFPIRLEGNWDAIQSALLGGGTIWVEGSIPYRPIFDGGQLHVMKFSYFLTVKGLESGHTFDTTAGHNEAT